MKHLITPLLVVALGGWASSASAIVSCKIEVEGHNGKIIKSFTATRGMQFGNRKVKKLHDCDTCWNGGKTLGPKKSYCGTKGEDYEVSCVKNSGANKKKTYNCP